MISASYDPEAKFSSETPAMAVPIGEEGTTGEIVGLEIIGIKN